MLPKTPPRPAARDFAFLFEDSGQIVLDCGDGKAAVITEHFYLRHNGVRWSVDFMEWGGNAWHELMAYDGIDSRDEAIRGVRALFPRAVEDETMRRRNRRNRRK